MLFELHFGSYKDQKQLWSLVEDVTTTNPWMKNDRVEEAGIEIPKFWKHYILLHWAINVAKRVNSENTQALPPQERSLDLTPLDSNGDPKKRKTDWESGRYPFYACKVAIRDLGDPEQDSITRPTYTLSINGLFHDWDDVAAAMNTISLSKLKIFSNHRLR